MADEELKEFDPSFLKDLADIIKNKTLFFIPFFGAFLAFLFAKTEYIVGANFVIWAFLAILFFGCVLYVQAASQLLWLIESLRMIYNVRKNGKGEWPQWETDKQVVAELLGKVPRFATYESRLYRKVMLMMYITTFVVLSDIFFGKMINRWIIDAAQKYLNS